MITIENVLIHSHGDESVGLFPASWQINEEIFIEPEDLEMFRKKLIEAFEYTADDVNVYFTINGKSEFWNENI